MVTVLQPSAGEAIEGDINPTLGTQILGEFSNCNTIPASRLELEERMLTAAKLMGATVVETVFHEFNPHGLSGVVVIAESHFAIHTWPESKCASVDLFTCSPLNLEPGFQYLKEALGSEQLNIVVVPRGSAVPRNIDEIISSMRGVADECLNVDRAN